mmetsp:Transcript_71259/g.202003  ORF Transcript_71259/g.202003 Transcript_71259/m.202003 type:complete len:251 (+) Transcript_71259:86-838(+)|eukprot:CAMPEP_0168396620 /NCGR_PEP_ID=MMETSP0228-20121227/20646_1 /TAXON_ID=133427 /ORGANISM="Protoceratium reticulatum, Strain CCCM 535 (=CCMP 1889)" /LENGTH=250 /DNA_ID=CAMNT_0008410075 /DNA_START=66 /DNA_END=818 /DNA_ORIENTATION=-
MGVTQGKEEASGGSGDRVAVQVQRAKEGYYDKANIDGYKKMRTPEGVNKNLDVDLMKAIAKSLVNDGKIDYNEAKQDILPKILDGRRGRSELTCNERWSIRYALGEFKWDQDARNLILHSFKKMDVMDVHDIRVMNPTKIERVLMGPSLEELASPPKKAKGAAAKLAWVDGMMLDREMLLACRKAVADDGIVDAKEAMEIFRAGADGGVLTLCERWTFRFILSAYRFTDAAFNFLVEAMATLEQTDSTDA